MMDRITLELRGEVVDVEFEFCKGEHGTAQMPPSADEVCI